MALSLLIMIAAALFVWEVGGVTYQLYFSPLAKFPGPKIAASSRWYEFYHDCIRKGKFYLKLQDWHRRYGIVQKPHVVC